MHYFFTFLILSAFLTHIACNSTRLFQSNAKGEKNSTSAKDAINHSNADVRKPIPDTVELANLSFSALSSIPTSDYYEESIASATNEVVFFEGYSFSDIRDFLLSSEDDFLSLANTYPTIGDYFSACGILSEKDLIPEKVEKGVAILKKEFDRPGSSITQPTPVAEESDFSKKSFSDRQSGPELKLTLQSPSIQQDLLFFLPNPSSFVGRSAASHASDK